MLVKTSSGEHLVAFAVCYENENEMKITIYMARTSRSVASESEARGHVTSQDES
jgi:hypothetical protein